MRFLLQSDKAGFEKVELKFREWQKQKGKLSPLAEGKF